MDLAAEVTRELRDTFLAPEPTRTIFKLLDALEDILELAEPRSTDGVDGPNGYKLIREICYQALGYK